MSSKTSSSCVQSFQPHTCSLAVCVHRKRQAAYTWQSLCAQPALGPIHEETWLHQHMVPGMLPVTPAAARHAVQVRCCATCLLLRYTIVKVSHSVVPMPPLPVCAELSSGWRSWGNMCFLACMARWRKTVVAAPSGSPAVLQLSSSTAQLVRAVMRVYKLQQKQQPTCQPLAVCSNSLCISRGGNALELLAGVQVVLRCQRNSLGRAWQRS